MQGVSGDVGGLAEGARVPLSVFCLQACKVQTDYGRRKEKLFPKWLHRKSREIAEGLGFRVWDYLEKLLNRDPETRSSL